MKKLLALLLAAAMLATILPAYAFAFETAPMLSMQDEDIVKAAVKGNDTWVLQYPNGVFNFSQTQYNISESQSVYEIAIARQGGTVGDASVRFKAVDISVEYGKDYVIRIDQNREDTLIPVNEDAYPLMDLGIDAPELNISNPDGSLLEERPYENQTVQNAVYQSYTVQQSVYQNLQNDIFPDLDNPEYRDISSNGNSGIFSTGTGITEEDKIKDSGTEGVEKDDAKPTSLRELRETYVNQKSDRPAWKEAAPASASDLKKEQDKFFRVAPGTETTISFQDGEYIKYLYIVPLRNEEPDIKGQVLFTLADPAGGAVTGEVNAVYLNFINENYEPSSIEIDTGSAVIRDDGRAAVTIRRIGGESNYTAVFVGTESGTAIAGEDYIPGLQQILFTPGMTEQTVVVDILENPQRTETREFKIAVDRKNKSVDPKKAEAVILIPPIINSFQSTRFYMAPLSIIGNSYTPWLPRVSTDQAPIMAPQAEKLSQFGYSPAKGQWLLTAQDFLNGSVQGNVFANGNNLILETRGGEAYARIDGLSRYGMDRFRFSMRNSGPGRQWTEKLWYTLWFVEKHRSEEEFWTTFQEKINLRDTYDITEKGVIGWKEKVSYPWQKDWLGYSTHASSGNKSTAEFTPLTIELKKYKLTILNDAENIPELQTKKYKMENGELVQTEILESGLPGIISIRQVYSNVKNEQQYSEKKESTDVYRSDLIAFQAEYTDGFIGRNSTLTGYEVYLGEYTGYPSTGKKAWKYYAGTTMLLDSAFFDEVLKESGHRPDGPISGNITVRPVFALKEANITLHTDTANGCMNGLGENTDEKKFTTTKRGDVLSLSATNYNASVTPVWSASNSEALISTDATGANTSVEYTLLTENNLLDLNFINPDLIVQANPNVYVHKVSKPVYEIEGIRYATRESLAARMEEVFEANTDSDPDNDMNPELALTFEYVFDENYPDPNHIKRNEFGSPQNAVLTVYRQDGSLRSQYSLPPGNGRYTFSGKLKDLGWEQEDYATVTIYGSKNLGNRVIATRETVIDFLGTSGNAVMVEQPDGTLRIGDIYHPVIVENTNAGKTYKMSAVTVPGFVTKWKDYSGDLDGDGQISANENFALEQKMKMYGLNLYEIMAKNPETQFLFRGDYFQYIPRFFNPSKVYYNFEKAPEASSGWSASIIVKEKFSTVLEPFAFSEEMPIKGVQVLVGENTYITDERGVVTVTDPTFEEGSFYLARILHKGFEFYTYVQPGATVTHVIDTSDIMRPFDFSVTHKDTKASALSASGKRLPIREGITAFGFRVDSGREGIAANDAIIRFYQTNEEGYRTQAVYQTRTGAPSGGVFAKTINLMQTGVASGDRMTISPLFVKDGVIEREYPEVDVGLIFSPDINIISAIMSFDTPITPVLDVLGTLDNRFDLGVNLSLNQISKPGEPRIDENGVEHDTLTVSFGFKDKGELSPEIPIKFVAITPQIEYDFDISLSLTIEEGPDGEYYFNSMHIKGRGNTEAGFKIGILGLGVNLFATVNVYGENGYIVSTEPGYFGYDWENFDKWEEYTPASINAVDSNRYSDKYRFDGEGNIPLFSSDDYDIDMQLGITPGLIGTVGIGQDWLSGEIGLYAEFRYRYMSPLFTQEEDPSDGDYEIYFNFAGVLNAGPWSKRFKSETNWFMEFFRHPETEPDPHASANMAGQDQLFSSNLYEPVQPLTNNDILSRDYLKNSSGWLADRKTSPNAKGKVSLFSLDESAPEANLETILEKGAYPHPQTKIVAFDNKLLALFIGDPGESVRDSLNRAQLFYSIYDQGVWSQPQPVTNSDGTWDEAPDAFVIEDKILVTWADAAREFTEQDDVFDIVAAMNISGLWFDIQTGEFIGEKIAITKETELDRFSDLKPMISYDPKYERILVYYTKIDYEDPRAYDQDSDIETLEADSDIKTYADLAHGYNIIAYRFAEKQEDGSFKWNIDYDPSEGLPAEHGFTSELLYGQRFLNLAAQVDVQEIETNLLENEGGVLIGTEQIVFEAANPNTDPLVIGSDLISYNELALYAYVLDGDGSKATLEDQELYLQIYNYELDTFHHPIKLTNNGVPDNNPKFVRAKGITYLYWISDGNIVYMDITNLVKNNLIKKEVEVNGVNRAIYIVDKSNTTIDGFVHMAIESKTDFPIEEFQIQSNGEDLYILFAEQVLTYKNGIKADSPEANDLANVNLEKQIFAAWSKPCEEIREVELLEAYTDTDSYSFEYAPGKGPGTYPAKVTVAESVYNDEGVLVFETGTHAMDYTKVPDANGYTGLVQAGDPVMQKQAGYSEGYPWSKPIQLTNEEGANYSDISFVVDDENNLQAVYIKYNQVFDAETGCFAADTSNRTFAAGTFDASSVLKTGEVGLSNETPQGGDKLRFYTEITNNGMKPVLGAQYKAYLKQNGEVLEESELHDISLTEVIEENNGERVITQKNMLPGGNSTFLQGEFLLPEELTNLVAGFMVTDENGTQVEVVEKAVQSEARPVITVLDATLTAEDTARLSLNIENTGNLDYAAKIDIAYASSGNQLKSEALQLASGETKKVVLDVQFDPSMFGRMQETENGSVYDELVLKATAGNCTQDIVIRRMADKAIMDAVNNVISFSIDGNSVSLEPGGIKTLNATALLNAPLPENTAAPLKTVWTTSNRDVASVLPDGTVVGLSRGTTVITASLEPVSNKTISLQEGSFEKVKTGYTLPAGIIKKDSVVVNVGSPNDNDDADEDETDKPNEKGNDIHELPKGTGIVAIKPAMEGQTGTITPDRNTVADALQNMKEENLTTLAFVMPDATDMTVSKLVLAKEPLKDIAASTVLEIAFEIPGSRITLEKETLEILLELLSQDGGEQEITIQISRLDTDSYSSELREMIGNRPVYDFSIFIGDTNIRDRIDIPMPLTLEFGNLPELEPSINPNQIAGAYITDSGQIELIPLSGMKDGKFVIETTHNSVYSALHHAVSFSDNSGWSKESIDFLAARGVVNGVGNHKFAPLQNITRAEFVKIMVAVAGEQFDKSVSGSSFTDVDPEKWYAPYIERAYSAGMVNGVGHGRFAPDENITRQDMAVLIARLADKLGYTLPVLNEEIVFADHTNISDYAREAAKAVQQAGIIQGRPGFIFAPKATATREECAAMITTLIRLKIGDVKTDGTIPAKIR